MPLQYRLTSRIRFGRRVWLVCVYGSTWFEDGQSVGRIVKARDRQGWNTYPDKPCPHYSQNRRKERELQREAGFCRLVPTKDEAARIVANAVHDFEYLTDDITRADG